MEILRDGEQRRSSQIEENILLLDEIELEYFCEIFDLKNKKICKLLPYLLTAFCLNLGRFKNNHLIGSGNVYGSYVHGIFDAPGIADAVLTAVCRMRGLDPAALGAFDLREYKERQYDLLADTVRAGLDMDFVYRVLRREA